MKRELTDSSQEALVDRRTVPRLDIEQVRARLRRAAEEECVPGSEAYKRAALHALIMDRLAPLLRERPTYVPASWRTGGQGGRTGNSSTTGNSNTGQSSTTDNWNTGN